MTATCSTTSRWRSPRARSRGTTRSFNVPAHPCDVTTDQSCLEFDPAFFDRANLEALVAANPNLGREINLVNNDLKTPYSDQFSLGVRNRFDLWNHSWNTSATVSYVESKDGIVFLLGNRRGNGSYRENPLAEWEQVPFGNGIPGLGTLITITNGIESRATSFLLSAEKPYTGDSKWGVTFAYTFTDAQENRTNSGLFDEHSIFDFPTVDEFGWHTATGVPMHRLVTTGIWDGPWELTLSAKLLLQSPVEFDALNCRDVPTAAERPPGSAPTTSASSRTSNPTRPSAASSSIWRCRRRSIWAISRSRCAPTCSTSSTGRTRTATRTSAASTTSRPRTSAERPHSVSQRAHSSCHSTSAGDNRQCGREIEGKLSRAATSAIGGCEHVCDLVVAPLSFTHFLSRHQ